MGTDIGDIKLSNEDVDDVVKSLRPTKAEMKAYKKMRKRHRKELKKMVKEDRPWDWEYFHDLIVLKLRQTYEYYVAGNYVHQAKEERKELLKSMKKVMDILDAIEHVDDPFNQYLKEHPYPEAKFVPNENGFVTIQYDEPDEIHQERHRIWTECRLNYGKLFEKFYAKLGKEMRNWWD